MMTLVDKTVLVTGANRGLGKALVEEALRLGAKRVYAGTRQPLVHPDERVTPLILDVTSAVQTEAAVEIVPSLDILINNAGFVRDRMLVNTAEDEWDAVIRVHLKGHFAPLRHAAAYWRNESKEGRERAARVINTSSGAGLQGSIGQTTYSAAKAGIAGMTLVAAAELGRYGVTVNAIAPVAKTRMTEGAFDTSAMPEPEDNSPVVAWLASVDAGDVTGRVIEIEGGQICLEQGWTHGPTRDAGRRWEAAEVGAALRELIAEGADPEPVYGVG